MFKSYYVVWKRVDTKSTQEKKEGLNRTMQYGNHVDGHKFLQYDSLNRTMQYGNQEAKPDRNCLTNRLNRTMQYGNNHAS